MTAAKRDLYIEQGATFEFSFKWCHAGSTPTTPGVPYDLTNAIARMQIRKAQKGTLLLDAKSDGVDPEITLGGITGRITVLLTDQDTDMLAYKVSVYDLEVELASGHVYRLLQGNVTVDPNVTQDTEDPVVAP
jgi:hypothetical protein